MTDATAALAQAHRRLSEGAAVDKRAIAAHRRALKEKKQALEEIESVCGELGIELVIEPPQGPQGGRST